MSQSVPEAMGVLEQWRPINWDDSDVQTLEPLLPTIRGWVERMDLPDAAKTRRFLLAAAGMAVWAYQSFGNIDPTVVFHPSNVEAWSMTVRADKSLRWRQTTRSRLRALGRVINAEGWPPPTQQVSKHAVARPYATVDEKVFRLVYRLPGPANRSQRLWIVSASLGAGLRGNAIAAAHTSDIENIGNGRLAVRVRGNNPRLVPIRTDYTDLVKAAADAAATTRFVPTNARNIVHTTVSRLEPRLSLPRARSTWLMAHLLAGTSLAVLHKIAGPLSATTLDGLLRYTVTAIDEETAALGALGA